MKSVFKILLVVVLVAIGVLLLDYVDGNSDLYSKLNTLWAFVCELPVIKEIINHCVRYSVSGLITMAVVIFGILYVIIHFVELLIKGVTSLVGKQHRTFQTKHQVKTIFHSAIIVKIILLAAKVVFLFTEAWGLSQFFHWVIGDPMNVYQMIVNDALFFTVLIVILLVHIVKRHKQQSQQPENAYYYER